MFGAFYIHKLVSLCVTERIIWFKPDTVANTYGLCYSRGWGRRIVRAQEFKSSLDNIAIPSIFE